MTLVTNVDGEHAATNPYDFCRHGAYVGGCGYDHMCGACEMGDPDLTLRQAQAQVDRLAHAVWADWAAVEPALDGLPDEQVATVEQAFADLPLVRQLGAAVRWRDDLVNRVNGPDDDQYLVREHRARKDRWDRYLIEVALDQGYTRVPRGFLAGSATPARPRRLAFLNFSDAERLAEQLDHEYD